MKNESDKPKKLYVDIPNWNKLNVDDFLISIGKNKSNSVYHIIEIKSIVPRKNQSKVSRYYLSVFKTDLLTAIKRDKDQKIIPFYWYSRKKK